MYYTVIKHDGHLRTRGKCRKHSPVARVFYISWVIPPLCHIMCGYCACLYFKCLKHNPLGVATLTRDQKSWLNWFKDCCSCFLGLSNHLGKILFLKWKVKQTYTGKMWTDYINTIKLNARFRQKQEKIIWQKFKIKSNTFGS